MGRPQPPRSRPRTVTTRPGRRRVSGLSLVAALTSLRAVRHAPSAAPGTAAIAQHLYERIAGTVRSLGATPRPDAGPVRIVIDARVAPADHDNQPPPRDGDSRRVSV
ncbi:hypothetical protein RB200_22595 [Streptomyces sp. PmtG]